jgi:hypothetical protein
VVTSIEIHHAEENAMEECEFKLVGEVAEMIGAKPRDISDLFYRKELRRDLCPVKSGRRLIPANYVPIVERILRKFGRQVREEVTSAAH